MQWCVGGIYAFQNQLSVKEITIVRAPVARLSRACSEEP